jgi:hypothetical protein
LDGLSLSWVAPSFRRLPPTDDKRREPLQRRSHIELEEYGIGMHATSKRLTILHVATINKPITSQIGYGPIETVIYNIDKGRYALGHRSIMACSSDSTVTGEKYETVSQSHGDYWCGCTSEGQAHVDLHLSRALARAQRGDIDIIHMHEWFERSMHCLQGCWPSRCIL